MSKRKNRSKSPNLPKETLDRARQQAEQPAPEVDDTEEPEVQEVEPEAPVQAVPVPKPAPRTEQPKSPRVTQPSSRRRNDAQPVQYTARKKTEMDTQAIGRILAHPTKIVTEAELRERYGYVLRDLRSMAILAAILVVVLVVLAQIL